MLIMTEIGREKRVHDEQKHMEKVERLYHRAKDKWLSLEEMCRTAGYDASGQRAIMMFCAQPDVKKRDNGIQVLFTAISSKETKEQP
jgi:hypothetical protein